MRRAPLVLAVLLVLAVGTACGSGSKSAGAPTGGAAPGFDGGELNPPRPLPGFALVDQSGRKVSVSDQRGKVVLVTFLYTHCPDVCPLITQNLVQALHMLGSQRADVRVLAVSVDPKGDTPKSVDRFAKVHHLPLEFHYLTGTRPELMKVWKAYDVAAVARDPELVDHTAYTMLADRQGQGRVIYDSQVKAAEVAHDARLLLSS